MGKRTGRPRGRPRKAPAPIGTPSELANRKLVEAGEAGVLFGLSEDEIQALLPRDVFRLTMMHAVRVGDLKLAREVAKDWAPYEHARKSETITVTPEELRRVATAAKSEAGRRGLVVDLAERRSA